MADTLTTFHSSTHVEDGDMEDDDEDRRSHRSSVSKLSICSTKTKQSVYGDDQEDGDFDYMMAHMSQLSLQNSSEIEADEEFSGLGDDSDRESGWNSLPAMRQREIWSHGGPGMDVESKSEGEGMVERSRRNEAMREREQWLERVWGMRGRRKEGGDDDMDESVESECVMIAKPKGGERRLCMDMDEMKACEDLGFELQPEWTLELPRGMSVSSVDTDSGRNSPLANFRISSPGSLHGDDPKDVKARLKMWAQAVASAVRLTS